MIGCDGVSWGIMGCDGVAWGVMGCHGWQGWNGVVLKTVRRYDGMEVGCHVSVIQYVGV